MGGIRSAAIVASLAFLFAGCVDPAPKTAPSRSETSAPAPAADEQTGSIAGTVSDDEFAPVPDAEVALVETGTTARTDQAGAFTFNALVPGAYTVAVQRLGYTSTGKKVTVEVGEVTKVQFTLQPIVLDNESFIHTVPKVALIHYGARILNLYGISVVNQSALNQLSCDPCAFVLHHPASPKQVMTEPSWPNGNACPNTNCDVWIYYKHVWTNAWYIGDGELTTYGGFANRASYKWPEAAVAHLKGKDKVLYALAPAYYGSVEHKVTTYTSFAYNGKFPEDFSALPPE